ncbi:Response regulator transcription factor [uncultured Gammaproteobacteria bacterium]
MAVAKRILLVGHDEGLRQSLAELLMSNPQCAIFESASGIAAFGLAMTEPFDVVVMDDDLPDRSGREVCRDWRDEGLTTPVMLLTQADRAGEAADSGADEILIKPFRLNGLLARLEYLTRGPGTGPALTIGRYTLHPDARLLVESGNGRQLRLTEKEAAILGYLHQAAGQVVGRETLLGAVWGYNSGTATHTVETHIYRLRQKIEPNPSHNRILVTEHGGYRLVTS